MCEVDTPVISFAISFSDYVQNDNRVLQLCGRCNREDFPPLSILTLSDCFLLFFMLWRNSCFVFRSSGVSGRQGLPGARKNKHSRKSTMFDFILNNTTWIALGFGVVMVFGVLEMLLRGLTTRYGTKITQ